MLKNYSKSKNERRRKRCVTEIKRLQFQTELLTTRPSTLGCRASEQFNNLEKISLLCKKKLKYREFEHSDSIDACENFLYPSSRRTMNPRTSFLEK